MPDTRGRGLDAHLDASPSRTGGPPPFPPPSQPMCLATAWQHMHEGGPGHSPHLTLSHAHISALMHTAAHPAPARHALLTAHTRPASPPSPSPHLRHRLGPSRTRQQRAMGRVSTQRNWHDNKGRRQQAAPSMQSSHNTPALGHAWLAPRHACASLGRTRKRSCGAFKTARINRTRAPNKAPPPKTIKRHSAKLTPLARAHFQALSGRLAPSWCRRRRPLRSRMGPHPGCNGACMALPCPGTGRRPCSSSQVGTGLLSACRSVRLAHKSEGQTTPPCTLPDPITQDGNRRRMAACAWHTWHSRREVAVMVTPGAGSAPPSRAQAGTNNAAPRRSTL